jgi:NAD(P)-dependent dehydrogenase (short-subunit alcohol dehydrogenase family)
MKNNKIALVTGGSRGIGKGIVQTLVKSDYTVVFTYNNNDALSKSIIKDYKSNGINVYSFQMDQSSRSSVQNCIAQIHDKLKAPITVLINNAAIAQEKPFETIDDGDWETMLKTNLQGPFMLIQEVLQGMIGSEFGRIVNITSIGGQWGGFNQVHYAASKAALINLTQSIAKIYSNKGITSNVIAIGLVQTEMAANELNSEEGKKKVSNIPIGRIGEVCEIADTVKFLCSNDASYITGQTINLNGGMYFG